MLPTSVFGFDAIQNTNLKWRYDECYTTIHSQPNDSKK